jgi:hypothetical protein
MSTRLRLLLSALVGLVVALSRLWFAIETSDFAWPLCAARALVAGQDPYGIGCLTFRPDGTVWSTNPLTTVIAMMPFLPFSVPLATALIFGLSSTLLAWGLLADGDPFKLILFLSLPFRHAYYYGQWSPLIVGLALSPGLLALFPIKPHIGIPAFLTRLTRMRLIGALVFVGLSLAIMPAWPWRWLALTTAYDGYIPLLTFPGCFTIVALLLWREPDARYLLLCAIVPQRGVYDALIPSASLRTRTELLLWTVSGYVIMTIGWDYTQLPGDWTVVMATYLPTTVMLFMRKYQKQPYHLPHEQVQS